MDDDIPVGDALSEQDRSDLAELDAWLQTQQRTVMEWLNDLEHRIIDSWGVFCQFTALPEFLKWNHAENVDSLLLHARVLRGRVLDHQAECRQIGGLMRRRLVPELSGWERDNACNKLKTKSDDRSRCLSMELLNKAEALLSEGDRQLWHISQHDFYDVGKLYGALRSSLQMQQLWVRACRGAIHKHMNPETKRKGKK